jgi:hypothetical protein
MCAPFYVTLTAALFHIQQGEKPPLSLQIEDGLDAQQAVRAGSAAGR